MTPQTQYKLKFHPARLVILFLAAFILTGAFLAAKAPLWEPYATAFALGLVWPWPWITVKKE